MKKTLLSVLTLALGCSAFLHAQSVPNGTFENWSSIPYDEPNGWSNSNASTMHYNAFNVTKVPGVTGSAIKIQTKVFGKDTIEGFFANAGAVDPTSGEGGVPYNQKAQFITGKYMANMVGNDSAIMLVMFKKSGVLVSRDFFKLGGKNQTTFSTFNFALSLPNIPDTVILAFASSNLETKIGVQNGSSIVFDDLAFTGLGVNKIIPNGNFESWTSKVIDIAQGWNLFSGAVVKDTDKYKGNYAIRLESIDRGQGEIDATLISTGIPGPQQGMPTGGRPFTNKIDTLCGYYKFLSSTGDSAMISYRTSKNGGPGGGDFRILKATSVYTYFQLPINLFATPDTIRIDVQSLVFPYSDRPKGTLYIDNLQLKSAPIASSVVAVKPLQNVHSFYPNPVKDVLTIELDATHNEAVKLTIYDISGKTVIDEKEFTGPHLLVNTSMLNSGIFYYIIETGSGQILRNKFLKSE